jgi:hypothetical protein
MALPLKAAIWSAGFTALVMTLVFAYPNQPAYLAIPGFIVALVLNGGGHESYLPGNLYFVVAGIGCFVFYWLLFFGILAGISKFRSHRRSTRDA